MNIIFFHERITAVSLSTRLIFIMYKLFENPRKHSSKMHNPRLLTASLVSGGVHTHTLHTPLPKCMLGYTPPSQVHAGIHTLPLWTE